MARSSAAARLQAVERIYRAIAVRAFKGHRSDGRPPEQKKPIKLDAVIFEGVLRVTGPALALKTIQHGIGPAKGLGFGLLLLGKRLTTKEDKSPNQ